jgi:DMSO/TMAO reductase YedYZ molybdopterin-dependent catalytic subunit
MRSVTLVLALTLAAQVAPRTNTLAIGGDVPAPIVITPAEFQSFPRTTVTLTDEQKRTRTFEGTLLANVLKRAGTQMGEKLRGQNMAAYILCTAFDGYEVVFSLPEVDPNFADNNIIIADTVDGKPLTPDEGPFRIITPRDKRGARAMRTVQKIDVVRLRK